MVKKDLIAEAEEKADQVLERVDKPALRGLDAQRSLKELAEAVKALAAAIKHD